LIRTARQSAKQNAPQNAPYETSGKMLKTKIGAVERRNPAMSLYVGDVEENDPSDLVAALRSQVDANNERLRRTREIVEVITQHLDSQGAQRKRRRRKYP
jgi:hypothetical protein